MPRRALVTMLTAACLACGAAAARTIESYATVRDDATLEVSNKHIRLHGIHVPETGQTCRTHIQPPRCSPRAALALDFKIQGFVHCVEKVRYTDGSIGAVCRVGRTYHWEGEDLGAYLLREGWAVATPDAPFEYKVLEDIARTRGRGVWGFQVDSIR